MAGPSGTGNSDLVSVIRYRQISDLLGPNRALGVGKGVQ